jgi:hypothetical protein
MANIAELVCNVNESGYIGCKFRFILYFFDSLRGECYHEQRGKVYIWENNPEWIVLLLYTLFFS